MAESQYDPNPNFGQSASLSDRLQSAWLLLSLPFHLTTAAITRPFMNTSLSFREYMRRALVRNILHFPVLSVSRKTVSLDPVKTSLRYKALFDGGHLNQRIQRADFAGNWVCKANFDGGADVAKSDIVIFFIHGGAYVTGHLHQYMPLLLRLSETISATRGLTVSIFALDYSLAPEHPFPCQLSQAATAYTYLTTELNIPPSNIVLTGDSAGGSIALSLLTHLRQPNPGVEMVLPREEKPKALFLLSPWVSLASEKGYKEKEASDILHPASLAGCVRYLLPTPAAVADAAPYLEFATPTPSRSCNFNELLPEHVWVSAGEDEIFLHNITSFVDEARKSGVKVEYEIESGKFHDWQLFDSVQNAGVFLGKERGARDEGEMEGVERIGRAVAGVFD